MKNRDNAKRLQSLICCDRCGMKEAHFVITFEPTKLEAQMGLARQGFYVCPNLYDPVTHLRLDTQGGPIPSMGEMTAIMGKFMAMIDPGLTDAERTAMAIGQVEADGSLAVESIREL
jgi:hypothetical protein